MNFPAVNSCWKALRHHTREAFPLVPKRGDFELQKVLESPYFFNWTFLLQRKLLQDSMKCCYLHFWGKIVQNVLLLRQYFMWSRKLWFKERPQVAFGKGLERILLLLECSKQYLFGWFNRREALIILCISNGGDFLHSNWVYRKA